MPVSKYRAAAADDVVTGNFWTLPLPALVLSVVLAVVWGCAAVTAAARKNANIKRGNRIGLPGVLEPSLHSDHNVTVVTTPSGANDSRDTRMKSCSGRCTGPGVKSG